MRNTKLFRSLEEYETWISKFENAYEYQMVPVVIDDGFKVSADLFVECKRWQTALRHFEKAFSKIDAFNGWIECIKESCESGYFKDIYGWMPANDENISEFVINGTYSFEVEEVSEGMWYIFLNVSGVFAGREVA